MNEDENSLTLIYVFINHVFVKKRKLSFMFLCLHAGKEIIDHLINDSILIENYFIRHFFSSILVNKINEILFKNNISSCRLYLNYLFEFILFKFYLSFFTFFINLVSISKKECMGSSFSFLTCFFLFFTEVCFFADLWINFQIPLRIPLHLLDSRIFSP